MNDLFQMPIKKGVDNVLDLIGTANDQNTTVMGKANQILGKVEDLAAASSGSSGDEMFVINALLSDDEGLNEWAFRQPNIGSIINNAFELGSSALAGCATVEAIAANSTAIAAISGNVNAMKACARNEVLAPNFIQQMPDEMALRMGYGYLKYNVGALVTIDYYGTPTQFRVVHKNYKTTNKIVLVSENILNSYVWHTSAANNYSSSALRTFLNSNVLGGFSQEIQDAIVTTAVACHNKATAVTCNDKIWALSYAEVGLGTATYAPAEGSVLSYFSSGGTNARIKTQNGTAAIWWLRTPYSDGTGNAWIVSAGGSATNYNVTGGQGVVPAFEI